MPQEGREDPHRRGLASGPEPKARPPAQGVSDHALGINLGRRWVERSQWQSRQTGAEGCGLTVRDSGAAGHSGLQGFPRGVVRRVLGEVVIVTVLVEV